MPIQKNRVFVTPVSEPDIRPADLSHSQLLPHGLVGSDGGGREMSFGERIAHLRFLAENANGPKHPANAVLGSVNG